MKKKITMENKEIQNSVFDTVINKEVEVETTTVSSTSTIPVGRNNDEYIYQVMFGNDDNEYYTFELPIISIDGQIIIKSVIAKGVLTEKVIDKTVEISYATYPNQSVITNSLNSRVLLARVQVNSLEWLFTTQFEAEMKIKDMVLNTFKDYVPQLFDTIKDLRNIIETQKNIKKNNNSNLIDI